MKSAVEGNRRQAQQAADDQTAAQNAAFTEQKDANLAAAKIDNQLAVQTIGANWQSLQAATRAQLLPMQRAWIRKKSADCRVEAASTSTDAKEIEVAKLNCDTRLTQERIRWLQQYRVEEAPEAQPEEGDAF